MIHTTKTKGTFLKFPNAQNVILHVPLHKHKVVERTRDGQHRQQSHYSKQGC